MKIELVVPIVINYMFPKFLESVEANSILPQRILLIDNTDRGFKPKSDKIEIVRLKSKTRKVNESWNLGIKNVSKKCEAVGIYNDDIILNPFFFQRIIETLRPQQCAVACPNTVDVGQSLKRGKVNNVQMNFREGWCFTIKRKILDSIPPIPDNIIKTFNGDSWFWQHTFERGYIWCKDLGNPIWHYKGVSVLATGERQRKRSDYWGWQQLQSTFR